MTGTEAGRAGHERGAGGDITVEVDRLAEDAVLAELAALGRRGARFSVLSEEAGAIDHGSAWPLVLVDPVDGSLNAKQGIPCFGAMFTLVTGPTVAEVRVGHVVNLVSGERWTATRGGGAWRDGVRVSPLPPSRPGKVDVLALESSPRSIFEAEKLVRSAGKIRVLGSMAISVAAAASGAVDVFCSPLQARVFDMTASALMVEEVGGLVTDIGGKSLAGLEVGFTSRTTLLASAHPSTHALALGILTS